MIRNQTIAVDFDGTCVTHAYPDIGREIGAAPVLRKLVRQGNGLILYTMRSGEALQEAISWFDLNRIHLIGVNQNPSQSSWTTSPKVYANLYIDDAAFGAPLVLPVGEKRPHINWDVIEASLCQ